MWFPFSALYAEIPMLLIGGYFLLYALKAISYVVAATLFDSFRWAMRLLLMFVCFWIPPLFEEQRAAYFVVFGASICFSLYASHLIAVQCGSFFAVNERLPKATSEHYRGYLTRLPLVLTTKAPFACHSYALGYVQVLCICVVGYSVATYLSKAGYTVMSGLGGMVAVCVLIPVAWGCLHWRFSFKQACHVCFSCLVTFLVYNRHDTTAAGVFQFPSRWLRPVRSRERLLAAAIVLFLISMLSLGPPPAKYTPPKMPDFGKAFVPSQRDKEISSRLPYFEGLRYIEARRTRACR